MMVMMLSSFHFYVQFNDAKSMDDMAVISSSDVVCDMMQQHEISQVLQSLC